jgi:hypothetical protein
VDEDERGEQKAENNIATTAAGTAVEVAMGAGALRYSKNVPNSEVPVAVARAPLCVRVYVCVFAIFIPSVGYTHMLARPCQ